MAERGCGVCAGCIGMGPCDDGTVCPGCGSCEDERWDDEEYYADGDYVW